MSDSSRPHGLQPTRLLHPWDFPGKSTGVGCHCLLRNLVLVFNKSNEFIKFDLLPYSDLYLAPFRLAKATLILLELLYPISRDLQVFKNMAMRRVCLFSPVPFPAPPLHLLFLAFTLPSCTWHVSQEALQLQRRKILTVHNLNERDVPCHIFIKITEKSKLCGV